MSSEKEKYQKRLSIIGAIGFPFYLIFALGAAAHFKGNAVIPLLQDPEMAFKAFIVGAVGAAIDITLAVYTALKIKKLS
ncbi:MULTISPECIES: hypothetical protein [Pseudoalteromonas]|uniref:Uncharacterized protein n=1 Tax=Pseudoalteromonas luteoviolacea (strain 2ta16) TaxID=1353533 RepID=V4HLE6_PSEL2|nr:MULTISPECIES: hypothetical protein [Pseudoalteromonas]ESP90598.1 hypothetical protein PL2TA16_01702 [Pseudoalteromonas luteoviolacea 2ta16]KZN41829.1 hypothetical protein N483_14250 [Pseudoalteromonas luteoviolacea NCIMB 1944]MCG7550428.1 hypothetical protein [Pseudoalteromonas sp. Of7M-16]